MHIIEITSPIKLHLILKFFCGSIFHRTDSEGRKWIKCGDQTKETLIKNKLI